MKFRRNLLIAIVALFLAWPALALAQPFQSPSGADGASATADPAKEEPKNAAENINVKLQIPLPFVKLSAGGEVSNLKDYIEGIYRLLIGVGALFAVVMIIIAGYQYLTSGGSADKTGAAKKRIFNASIGLILALMSYVILNAISARLVDMELPIVAPVQRFEFNLGDTCQTTFAYKDGKFQNNAFNQYKKIEVKAKESALDASAKPVDIEATLCGTDYVAYGDGKEIAQCAGGYCSNNKACILGKCRNTYLYGKVNMGLFSRAYIEKIGVYKIFGARGIRVHEKSFSGGSSYAIPKPEIIESGSGAAMPAIDKEGHLFGGISYPFGEFKGYALRVEVNDALAIDNEFIVGHNCSKALHAFKDTFLSDPFVSLSDIKPEQLISQEEIDRSYQCNIDFENSSFSDFD
ncbi:MAG: hypothetical protein A3H70_03240 [Candidatus Komeilibacteria bacterium RIFCSPLOWO2_02_FULL_48_11]|uniref:Uncharacterized protein n=1 Tax=Candidatus Komeilibacteria bacterium RIFCSPLOWO2_02_FULL_48_11 TaxID=1798553 RepID=A0A1G2BR34_9BACT|nr:MAG: hypothetical protein A3H70_03240 [Candidatus Komeilibacteria bacterium RIFCSPLOWO2_02_FULL_48_11]